jgi:hypothetical protein
VQTISLAITSLEDHWFIPWLVNLKTWNYWTIVEFVSTSLHLASRVAKHKKLMGYNFMHYILLHFSIVSFQEIQNEHGYGPCDTCKGSKAMSRKSIHRYKMSSLNTLKKNLLFFCNSWLFCN